MEVLAGAAFVSSVDGVFQSKARLQEAVDAWVVDETRTEAEDTYGPISSGAGEKKGGGLGQTTCAFMAAISVDKWFAVAAAAASRRLALAVFVAALAPAEASGVFNDKAGLEAALDDLAAAVATHGPIAGWDVSRVDDFKELFAAGSVDAALNEAIGGWDTSRVTNMCGTFWGAYAFNQPLAWDTSQVTYMAATSPAPIVPYKSVP